MTARSLEESAEESLFGGKAASLARALRAGLPVPPGFAISWDMVSAIASGERPPEVLARFRSLGGTVSVRSSAIGEDSSGASFAGQHLTVLGVTTEEELFDAIRRVHDSANAGSALEYRRKVNAPALVRIGVVVQQLIDARTSGVLFTQNPITGADERMIEASWGLGEAVVAGLVTPDRYRVARGGEIIRQVAGTKDIEIRYSGAGTVEREVDEARRHQLCLTPAVLSQLDVLAGRCETEFGRRIDLEWAVDENGRLFLLQSRPITTGAAAPEGLPPRKLAGFGLAAILNPLNSTMIAVALPSIAADTGASAASLTLWLVSAYLLVSILVQSPSGKLADVFGYSPVLTTGRVLFGAGAILGALAPSLPVLALSRILMAVGGSLNLPPVMAEIRNAVAPERRGRVLGFFGALMGTAAAIGPIIGEVLIRSFGWHSVFLVNLPLLAASLLLEPPHRRVTASKQRTISFDLGGTILFAVATCAIVAGIQFRSLTGVVVAMGGVAVMIAFAMFERRVKEPLIDPALFSRSAFTAGGLIIALQNFTMYAVLFLVPFMLGDRKAAGSFLLAMTGAMVIASAAGGRLSDAFGPRYTAVAGALVASAGGLMLVLHGASTPALLVTTLGLLGAGIGLSGAPAQAAALSAVGRESAGAAAGALATMRYIGGVLGSGLVGVIVSHATGSAMALWLFPVALVISIVMGAILPRSSK